jgi:hypothetical protein
MVDAPIRMNQRRTREELEAVVRQELAQADIVPEKLEVLTDAMVLWWIKIEIAGRGFSIGWVYRDGFFCEETTEGRAIDFTARMDPPVSGREDRLRLEGFRLVRYAVDHPEFRGFVRPVI